MAIGEDLLDRLDGLLSEVPALGRTNPVGQTSDRQVQADCHAWITQAAHIGGVLCSAAPASPYARQVMGMPEYARDRGLMVYSAVMELAADLRNAATHARWAEFNEEQIRSAAGSTRRLLCEKLGR